MDASTASSASGQGAVAVASLASSAESGSGSGYLPSTVEQLGISSIAYASSLVANCTDLGTLIPTSIVLQGYVSLLLNNLTNAKVSSADFKRQASSEVREYVIALLPHCQCRRSCFSLKCTVWHFINYILSNPAEPNCPLNAPLSQMITTRVASTIVPVSATVDPVSDVVADDLNQDPHVSITAVSSTTSSGSPESGDKGSTGSGQDKGKFILYGAIGGTGAVFIATIALAAFLIKRRRDSRRAHAVVYVDNAASGEEGDSEQGPPRPVRPRLTPRLTQEDTLKLEASNPMQAIRCGSPQQQEEDINLQHKADSPRKRSNFFDVSAACHMADNPLYRLSRRDLDLDLGSAPPIDEDLQHELQGVTSAMMASMAGTRAASRPSAVPTTSDRPRRQQQPEGPAAEGMSVVATLSGQASSFLWGTPRAPLPRPAALSPRDYPEGQADEDEFRGSPLKSNRRLTPSAPPSNIRKRTVSGGGAPQADKRITYS